MNLQTKRKSRKYTAWINTRFALPHKRRVAFRRICGISTLTQTIATISAIRSTFGLDKTQKTIAIANTIMAGYESFAAVMNINNPLTADANKTSNT